MTTNILTELYIHQQFPQLRETLFLSFHATYIYFNHFSSWLMKAYCTMKKNQSEAKVKPCTSCIHGRLINLNLNLTFPTDLRLRGWPLCMVSAGKKAGWTDTWRALGWVLTLLSPRRKRLSWLKCILSHFLTVWFSWFESEREAKLVIINQLPIWPHVKANTLYLCASSAVWLGASSLLPLSPGIELKLLF